MAAEGNYLRIVIYLGFMTIKVVTSTTSVAVLGGAVAGVAVGAVLYKVLTK